jgi:hypothetical protein
MGRGGEVRQRTVRTADVLELPRTRLYLRRNYLNMSCAAVPSRRRSSAVGSAVCGGWEERGVIPEIRLATTRVSSIESGRGSRI